MSDFFQDLRFSARLLSRSPGFFLVAVLTLALGIGANSAVFSLLDAVLLRPLPYANPERLVWLWESNAARKLPVVPASPANFADWARESRMFEAMAAWRDVNLTLTGAETPERLSGARVFPQLLDVLGIQPVLGRGFAPGEGTGSGAPVAIVTHGMWQRRFGGDPALAGRTIQLDGVSHTVIGVLPPSFRFPFGRVEVLVPWIPSAGELAERGAKFRYLRVVARLKAGVPLRQAQTEMAAIAQRLEQAYPASNKGWGVNVMPMREFFVAEFRLGLISLGIAVVFVALIACSNVASLLLARAEGRRREVAIRTAVGAGRWRLLRQFLTESVLLGLAGGAAGVLLARAGIGPLLSLVPEMNLPIPGLDAVRLDWRAVAFTAGLSVAAGILFGLAPVGRMRPEELHEALKEGGRGDTAGIGRLRVRSALIVLEIAVAVALSIGTGLLIQSFQRMAGVNPGFRTGNAMTFRVSLPVTRYSRPEQQRAFYRQLAQRIRALPSVTGFGLATYVPLAGAWGIVRFTIDGRPVPAGETPSASNQVVTPGYFETMGIGLASGRFFTEQDDENAPRVAVVNETLARRFWPGQAAVGQRIHLEGEAPDAPPLVVVGVARDVHQLALSQDPEPELYRCYYQAPTATLSAVVRTAADPLNLVAALRREVAALDPGQPVFGVETLSAIVANSMWQTRLTAVLFTAFSTLALILAAVGVYGLTSFLVAQRTREIGLRLAMGATAGDVLRMVLARGLGLALAGVAGGVAAAWSLARAMSSALYGVGAADPATYLAASLFLLAVAAVANLVPAVRAARTDPIAALRHE